MCLEFRAQITKLFVPLVLLPFSFSLLRVIMQKIAVNEYLLVEQKKRKKELNLTHCHLSSPPPALPVPACCSRHHHVPSVPPPPRCHCCFGGTSRWWLLSLFDGGLKV